VIAENAKWLLRQRGLSQAEFARRMNGMSLTAWKDEKVVRRFLRGQRQLKPTELLAVALILETTVQVLMMPGLEQVVTQHGTFDRVRVGPLLLHGSELAVLLADKDHSHNPLRRELPSGVVFAEEGKERIPSWRAPDMWDALRDSVRGLSAQAYLPIPDDVDTASPDQLQAYMLEAMRRIDELWNTAFQGGSDET
jgi:transcriptional regulator with XRE-family HTH domain